MSDHDKSLRYEVDSMSWLAFKAYDPVVSEEIKSYIQNEQDLVILSPSVGTFYQLIQKDKLYQSQDKIGLLEVLSQKFAVHVPLDFNLAYIQAISRIPLPCGYRQVIGVAHILDHTQEITHGSSHNQYHTNNHDLDLPTQAFAIEAPIDGMLYYTASPDLPPFVEVGQEIQPNTVVALIEVMKFFYEIRYEGQAPARICSCPLSNACSIEAGQALYYLVPLT